MHLTDFIQNIKIKKLLKKLYELCLLALTNSDAIYKSNDVIKSEI